MTYDPTVPAASQRISDTQAPIQNNFTVLNDIFNEDHFNYDDASGDPPPPGLRGFHRMSTYSELGGDPTAFPDIGTVYTKDNGDGRTDLFYRYDDDTLGNSKILPLSATKVMCAWNVAVADGIVAPAQIFQAYNISSITKSTAANFFSFTFVFADKLDSNPAATSLDYIVLLTTGSTVLMNSMTYRVPTTNSGIIILTPRVNFTFLRASIVIMTL